MLISVTKIVKTLKQKRVEIKTTLKFLKINLKNKKVKYLIRTFKNKLTKFNLINKLKKIYQPN